MKYTYLVWNHINHIKLGPMSLWHRIKLAWILGLARLAYAGVTVKDSNGLYVKLSPNMVASCQIVEH